MRVFIAGANGQLGSELAKVAERAGHRVFATDVDTCDLLDPRSVARNLDQAIPDLVINCAAWTKVDAAETEQQGARRLNVEAPANLAIACYERGLPITHISTDYVFDGTATSPIAEDAAPHPASVYGQTKLAGEQAVMEANGRAQIVRTAWLYGQKGPNFVLTMLRLAREKKKLRVVADQYGSPTWTGHLAPAVLRLAGIGRAGVFHITNSGQTTWSDFAKLAIETAGIKAKVIPITTAEYPTPAPRPAYSVLDNAAWRDLGEEPLPDWSEGVRAYVAELQGAANATVK